MAEKFASFCSRHAGVCERSRAEGTQLQSSAPRGIFDSVRQPTLAACWRSCAKCPRAATCTIIWRSDLRGEPDRLRRPERLLRGSNHFRSDRTALRRCLRPLCQQAVHQLRLPGPGALQLHHRRLVHAQLAAGEEPGHDHFFATFDKFLPAMVNHTGDAIAEATARAASDHLQYLELMHTADGTLAANNSEPKSDGTTTSPGCGKNCSPPA